MSILRNNLVSKITAILVIFMLVISDILFVGVSVISYAIDVVKTNSSNIEYTAYFMDENGEKTETIERDIDKEEYLYVDLSVKNEGYFNGSILINNSNFKISEEILSPAISSISGNQVTLNQINAGSTETIKLKIEAIKEETITETILNTKTEVMLQGQYVNSKNVEKDKYVDIKGTSVVEVKWKSSEETNAELNAELLTNSIYNVNGEEKRVVQILIRSRVTNNNYPIKNTEINLNVLDNVQEVRVHARSTAGTNKNIEFGQENYIYDEENQNVTIKLLNEDTNNISWSKNAVDEIVVTYILDKNENITNNEIVVNSQINTYDDKGLSNSTNVYIDREKDGIVSYSLTNSEDSIYKGKIYTGEEREYTEKSKINVDFLDTVNTITLTANKATYLVGDNELEANTIYKETKINKEEFIKIFGEEGYVTIKDESGNVIANITKEAQADENGNIIVTENTTKIEIIVSKPIKIGTLNIENKKAILNSGYTREQINEITNIKEAISGNYNSKENNTKESKIELKNTSSNADLKVNVSKLTSVEQNKNVKITVALKNNDESKDLYQNPIVKITLPKEVTKVVEPKCRLLYGNGLSLNQATIEKENENYIMKVSLSGTQNSYNTEVIEGTTLIIYANLELDKSTVDSDENITLNYTNEIATSYLDNGVAQIPIKIEGGILEQETQPNVQEQQTNELVPSIGAAQKQIATSLKAYVGGEEIQNGGTVNSGEVITYELTVKNTGTEPISTLTVTGTVPENAKYVKFERMSPEVDKTQGVGGEGRYDDGFLTLEHETPKFEMKNLGIGEQKIFTYDIMVNNDADDDSDISSNITVNYDDNNTSVGINHKIKSAEMKLTIIMTDRQYTTDNTNRAYLYKIIVENLKDEKLKDVKIKINGCNILGDAQLFETQEEFVIENNEFTINEIDAKSTNAYVFLAKFDMNDERKAKISVVANDKYRSNQIIDDLIEEKVSIEMTSSNKGNTVRPGDEIDYDIVIRNEGTVAIEKLVIEQQMSIQINVKNVTINGEAVKYDMEVGASNIENACTITINNRIDVSSTLKINVETATDSELEPTADIPLKSIAKAYNDYELLDTSEEIDHILSAETYIPDPEITPPTPGGDDEDDPNKGGDDDDDDPNKGGNDEDDPSKGGDDDNDPNNDNPGKDENEENNAISGTAWFDENENGQRDSSEKTLEGIKVSLLDMNKNEIITTTTTSSSGFYSLKQVPNGRYVAIFEYDTGKYILTTYKADGVQESRNSDVENVTMNINGKEQSVSSTDTLEVNGQSLTNIDIGLVEAKVFDLELSKSISKITVINKEGTKTTNYDNVKLAKVDIKAKNLSGSTVVIEYKINVKNNGEMAGYAKKIVDYKPNDLSFNSELNSNWYQSGEYLYSNSLSNTKIGPGETKELTLVLTKTMTETNTGLVNNTAEIGEDYNSLNIKDKDSTPGNKQKSEDDMDSCDTIISVKTGIAISFVSITLSLMAIITAGAYIIGRKLLKKNIKL